MKYPIGIQSFDRIIEDGYVYIDKTDMVYSLVHEGSIYFMSRPRRFGKSLLVSTLKNYFLGRKELFKGLKTDSLEKEWKVYPVFHVDFNGSNFTKQGILENRIASYVSDWEKQYSLEAGDIETDLGNRFMKVLKAAHEQSGRRAVVLIDEYDKPILDVLDVDKHLEEEHRNILKAFYSVFKGADEHLQFVFLTGVMKFSQVSVFSGFNQPKDISMNNKYEALCGITQEELDAIFREPVESMAEAYHCSYDEMRDRLKAQYDGYHFSLIRLLSHTDEQMDDITGKFYAPKEFIDYKADVEQPLPMIYQSGYLTIKAFDMDFNLFLLDYPNKEVKEGFLTMVASKYFDNGDKINPWVREATIFLRKGEVDNFRTGLTSFLASIPYTMHRKENERERERYFHYTFYLLLRLLSVYTVYTEKVQSQGRVDCVVEIPQYVYIFEFKLDGTADEALRQIEEKGYVREYASDNRKLYKIGAVFSSDTGTISDWKSVEA